MEDCGRMSRDRQRRRRRCVEVQTPEQASNTSNQLSTHTEQPDPPRLPHLQGLGQIPSATLTDQKCSHGPSIKSQYTFDHEHCYMYDNISFATLNTLCDVRYPGTSYYHHRLFHVLHENRRRSWYSHAYSPITTWLLRQDLASSREIENSR